METQYFLFFLCKRIDKSGDIHTTAGDCAAHGYRMEILLGYLEVTRQAGSENDVFDIVKSALSEVVALYIAE